MGLGLYQAVTTAAAAAGGMETYLAGVGDVAVRTATPGIEAAAIRKAAPRLITGGVGVGLVTGVLATACILRLVRGGAAERDADETGPPSRPLAQSNAHADPDRLLEPTMLPEALGASAAPGPDVIGESEQPGTE